MTSRTDALAARWRRYDRSLIEVDAAAASADPHACPDAVVHALEALYDLWELWSSTASLSMRDEDAAVRGYADGELTAALVHARGAKTHAHVEFGHLTDAYTDRYYDHHGCWTWQPHTDPDPRYVLRDRWYGLHVANREVSTPLEGATRWLRSRAELV